MGVINSPITIGQNRQIDTDGQYDLIKGGSNTTGRVQIRAAGNFGGVTTILLGYWNSNKTGFEVYTDETGAPYPAFTGAFSVELAAGRHSRAAFQVTGIAPGTTDIELEVTELS